MMNNHRIDSLKASVKKVEVQVGQLLEHTKKQKKGQQPSQTKQAKHVRILQSCTVINKILPEISNDLPSNVSNKEGETIVSQEGEKKISNGDKLSVERIRESTDIPKLLRSPNTPQAPIPFPHRLKESKQYKQLSDLFVMLFKVNINLNQM